jgi:hypothetical protein
MFAWLKICRARRRSSLRSTHLFRAPMRQGMPARIAKTQHSLRLKM